MSEVILCGCRGCTQARKQERDRIKALIASLEYDGDYCKVLHSCDLLTAVDGEGK